MRAHVRDERAALGERLAALPHAQLRARGGGAPLLRVSNNPLKPSWRIDTPGVVGETLSETP